MTVINSIRQFCKRNSLIDISAYLILMTGGVIFLLLSGIPPRDRRNQSHDRFSNNIRNFVHAFWPIVLVAALYAGFNLSPAITILLAIAIFLIVHKVPSSRWAILFKSGVEPDFALLILGALLFKLNLEAGQAIPAVVEFFSEINVPPHFLIFFLPFIVGFLTGVTMPTVAITFPFLMPFIGTGQETKVQLQTLAFSGLLCGLFLTPVHLCLSLSASYFEAPLVKIVDDGEFPFRPR